MKKIFLFLTVSILLASCASTKELEALKTKHNKTKEELLAVKNNLTKCLIEKEKYQDKSSSLTSRVNDLRKDKENTLQQVENLTVLTKGANDNIKETLTQLSKKDKYINRIRAAASKKDSLNLVSFSFKERITTRY